MLTTLTDSTCEADRGPPSRSPRRHRPMKAISLGRGKQGKQEWPRASASLWTRRGQRRNSFDMLLMSRMPYASSDTSAVAGTGQIVHSSQSQDVQSRMCKQLCSLAKPPSGMKMYSRDANLDEGPHKEWLRQKQPPGQKAVKTTLGQHAHYGIRRRFRQHRQSLEVH